MILTASRGASISKFPVDTHRDVALQTKLSSCGSSPATKTRTDTQNEFCTAITTLFPTLSSLLTASSPCLPLGTTPSDFGTSIPASQRVVSLATRPTFCLSASVLTTGKSCLAPVTRLSRSGILWESASLTSRRRDTQNGTWDRSSGAVFVLIVYQGVLCAVQPERVEPRYRIVWLGPRRQGQDSFSLYASPFHDAISLYLLLQRDSSL